MKNRFYIFLCLWCFSTAIIKAQIAPAYEFILVETGEFSSRANSINEDGLIGGSRTTQLSSNVINPAESYLWLDGAVIWSGHLGGQLSGVSSVNNNGMAVGQAKTPLAPFNGLNCGFQVDRFEQDMQPLTALSVFNYNSANYAYAINDQGNIVGNSRIYDEELGEDAYNAYHAVLWNQDGNVLDLGTLGAGYSRAFAINENNEIGGAAIPTNGDILHAVRWTIDTEGAILIEDIHDIANSTFTDVIDINDAGTILGEALIDGSQNRVVIWDSTNVSTVLELANGASCFAGAINNHGDIVGYCEVFSNGNRVKKAYLYQDESFYFLEDIVEDADVNRSFEFAYDINDKGWIVGSSTSIINDVEKKESYCVKPQTGPLAVSNLNESPFTTATLGPNPSNGQLITINLKAKERTVISGLVFDIMGRKVASFANQQELITGENMLSWQPQAQLASGLYQIVIDFPKGQISLPLQLIR